MTPSLSQARAMGEFRAGQASARAEQKNPGFAESAANAMLAHLDAVREAPGEDLVDIARAKGARPTDDRAFGSIFTRLRKAGEIHDTGRRAPRKKGHGTEGGRIWGRGAGPASP
jgi:hypothetical protein